MAVAVEYLHAVADASPDELAKVTAYSVLSDDSDAVVGGGELPPVCLRTELEAMSDVDPHADVEFETIGGPVSGEVDDGGSSYQILMAYFPLADGSSLGRQVGLYDEELRVFIEPSDPCEDAVGR
ncbi:hypothetical protein [Isoptericola sp. NPDC055881]